MVVVAVIMVVLVMVVKVVKVVVVVMVVVVVVVVVVVGGGGRGGGWGGGDGLEIALEIVGTTKLGTGAKTVLSQFAQESTASRARSSRADSSITASLQIQSVVGNE